MRVISEQSFGTWKQRFPMVLGVVRVQTKQVARIVQATLALHNFIIKSGGGYIEVPENVLEQDMG